MANVTTVSVAEATTKGALTTIISTGTAVVGTTDVAVTHNDAGDISIGTIIGK